MTRLVKTANMAMILLTKVVVDGQSRLVEVGGEVGRADSDGSMGEGGWWLLVGGIVKEVGKGLST